MSRKLLSPENAANTWQRRSSPIIVGKDLLELLSSSMYVDPMTVYREYIQNSADAIDEARRKGLLLHDDSGCVDIHVDTNGRTVRIRDNGTGIGRDQFEERLTAFGASLKRGTRARGFRGVGRLAGLGYCQELIFRARTDGEGSVGELRWDCRNIKALLRTAEANLTLQDVVNSVVDIRYVEGKGFPNHFFEVELRGIVRHKNDALLNPFAIYDYLSEVAPVPFSPDFQFGELITSTLADHIALGNLNIHISGIKDQIYRPHRNNIEIAGATHDRFIDVEICPIPSVDGGLGALAWFLHHDYKGAVPVSHIRGLRLRSGNIQVGGRDLLQDLFAEMRFNSWTVGEVHTIDSRIVPNGRRDHFEQNIHFNNLTNHISPIARQISTRCRLSSILRNLLRDFQRREAVAREKLQAIKQGSLGSADRRKMLNAVEELINGMRRLAARELLTAELKVSLKETITTIEKELTRARRYDRPAKALAQLPVGKRRTYEQVFALIYECSNSHASAHVLVERILGKLD